MDHEKPTGPLRNPPEAGSEGELAHNPAVDDFFRRLKQDLHHPKPGTEAIAAALQAVQRLASQVDTDDSVSAVAETAESRTCLACGSLNPAENRFCAICGVPQQDAPSQEAAVQLRPVRRRSRRQLGSTTTIIIIIITISLPPKEACRWPVPSRAQRVALPRGVIPGHARNWADLR